MNYIFKDLANIKNYIFRNRLQIRQQDKGTNNKNSIISFYTSAIQIMFIINNINLKISSIHLYLN